MNTAADRLPLLSKRIAAITASATLKVDAQAKAMQAAGRAVISYAAGEPDFATPAHIVDAARAALEHPKNFRYTAAAGLPTLRQAIAEKTARDAGWPVDAGQVIVTNGGKQAVYQAFQVLLNPGDEVIVPAPYWTSYPESIRLAGGTSVPVFAGAEQGYKVTVEQLEAARTARTKVLLFVSPANPTGAVYSAEETQAIGEWATRHGLWVVADEIYQQLVYDGVVARSIVDLVPELRQRTILVDGVAKSYAMTGWRVGWMVAPKEPAALAATLQSHLCSNVNNIAQLAALAALEGPKEPVAEMRRAFDRRRKIIVTELNRVPGFRCPTPEGAFYAYVDVSGALGGTITGSTPRTSLELAEVLLAEAEVAAVPGEAFGAGGYLRFSYALGDEQLLTGMRRIQALLSA